MWWRHELLHRASLRNYPDRIAAYGKLRDELEQQFLERAASAGDRAGVTAACFEQTAAAEQEWLHTVRDIPATSTPLLYRRAWRKWDELAGMP